MKKLHGFVPYGSTGDPDYITHAGLKSASDLGGGSVVGTPTFSGDGVLCAGAGSGILFDTLARYRDLYNAGHISFTINGEFFGEDYEATANDQLFCAVDSSNVQHRWYKLNGVAYRMISSYGADLNDANNGWTELSKWGKNRPVRVVISWQGSIVETYVDAYLVNRYDRRASVTQPARDVFQKIFIGGSNLGTARSGPQTYAISDVQIIARPVVFALDSAKDLREIAICGDSFTTLGDYPSGKNAIKGTASQKDAGFLPTLHRELMKKAVYVSRISNYGNGGSGVAVPTNLLETQVDAVLASNIIPSICYVHLGTNDMSSGAVDLMTAGGAEDATKGATWKAVYQTQIDRLTSAGCSDIRITTPCPADADSTVDYTTNVTPTWYVGKMDYIVKLIKEVAAANAEVTVVDLFNLMGGHDNYDQDDYGANRHPSAKGYQRLASFIVSEGPS